ncbi:Sodium/hydrogen exchanger 7 [Symbiodinium microadriaticum]|uniref:Sodium/hydrogen exchanger 7 n=1 Tax=Symbiodinium microadriaticum TaxID=2951 RepID=A0A1Q9CRP6_SYMMI|nr:Sodium/hydrogen exchanger 7 [Symbiodinium microadriaticum]
MKPNSLNKGAVNTTGSDHEEGHHSHPHDGLFFLLLSFTIGTLITALTMVRYFKGLQQTVALFITGIIIALIHNAVPVESRYASWETSWQMWMDIDPHLLLFTMLPSLLMADAMTIHTGVAMRVAKQCIYLAGPGVLINALLAACFLYVYLPYQWPFLLCLTTGSILCATDPVAVVALLKELGASPTLTVLIQGEALLNDGTAIVLYLMAYSMLEGTAYDAHEAVNFLTRTIAIALATGGVVGLLAYLSLKVVGSPFDHSSGIIQTVITFGCAYVSFYLSEGLFSASGEARLH